MKSLLRLEIIGLLFLTLGTATAFGVTRCCQSVASDTACSGCTIVPLSEPSGLYVNLGSNSTMTCNSTPAPANCTDAPKTCVSLQNVDMCDNNTCSHVVFVGSCQMSVRQCDSASTACAGG